ncbi:hypothetical protein LSH36_743g00003 [Paralvinella palmiformis]|uniref:Uncharacterized protein n=1 Tax=Paralvinella palmiformis TaxID=53620 RepID=A0AAD9MT93_9ANNE|nr:hypothetical protein LSH36_743g00003 [Paralvinella palmiformis]
MFKIILVLYFTVWTQSCVYDYEVDGIFVVIAKVIECGPWVFWISLNAIIHLIWVITLLSCQLYQIAWLSVTTNERMNFKRYKYFQKSQRGSYSSPFGHGVLRNLINHFECSCFGLFRPDGTDWMNKFDVHDQVYTAPRSFLTNARDNYQFV